tara:strand:- start:12757 stop:13707 length:951 start_codon:yes stop_codon:yes gene_type:complete
MDILEPKSTLNLYGYNYYFKSFIKLFKTQKLPKVMLLSGPKGLGKSTFSYHFINYILSQEEKYQYSLNEFVINSENSSYKLVLNNTHPSLFVLDDSLSVKNIKIDQVRNLLKFLTKTSSSKNIKIVLIDNSEYLNINASNALLKSLEEPPSNTYFIIINNDTCALLETIKSRCVLFKINFNFNDKRNIFYNLKNKNDLDFDDSGLELLLNYDTPGNILKYFLLLKESKINISEDSLLCINYLIEKVKTSNDHNLIDILTLFIEFFYTQLSLNNSKNINRYFFNKYRILRLIYDMRKFNLDKKSLFNVVSGILKNEK